MLFCSLHVQDGKLFSLHLLFILHVTQGAPPSHDSSPTFCLISGVAIIRFHSVPHLRARSGEHEPS